MKGLLRVVDILDEHDIAWSAMGECIFVSNDDRIKKIKSIASELLKVKSCKQGFDADGNYLAFER